MKTKQNRLSEAAKFLRAIPSKKRSEQSRVNGRKGGRKPSGVCSERELMRRVRAWGVSAGLTPALIALNQRQAKLLRRSCVCHPDRLEAYFQAVEQWPWVPLLPHEPRLL